MNIKRRAESLKNKFERTIEPKIKERLKIKWSEDQLLCDYHDKLLEFGKSKGYDHDQGPKTLLEMAKNDDEMAELLTEVDKRLQQLRNQVTREVFR